MQRCFVMLILIWRRTFKPFSLNPRKIANRAIRTFVLKNWLLPIVCLTSFACGQQGAANILSAAQFGGEDVAGKVRSAQSTCLSKPNIPCTILIDSSMAQLHEGILPLRCPNCTWIDLRNPGELSLNGLLNFGNAPKATFPGFPVSAPQSISAVQAGSSEYYASPALYLSRVDSTAYGTDKGQCFQGPLAACDAPIAQVDFTNQTRGNIPGMIGVSVFGWGFRANGVGSSPFSNYEVGFGANMQDAAVPNITNLRAANFIVVVNGLPTTKGTGGFTRTGVTLEGDVNNSSGVDAEARVSNREGNYIAGVTMVANGNNSSSVAFGAGSSAPVVGKGWRAGFLAAGVTDVGFGEYRGGRGSFSPAIGFAAQAENTVGFLCGAGTVHTDQGTGGNPETCLLVDALGTPGKSETVNSGVIALRAKKASTSGTDWHIQHIAGDSLQFTLVGAGNYLKLGDTGDIVLAGAASQHLGTAAANNDIDGAITIRAGTTSSHVFAKPYASAPSCVLTPTSDPSMVGGWWVTTSPRAVAANVKVPATIAFNYHCVGSPR